MANVIKFIPLNVKQTNVATTGIVAMGRVKRMPKSWRKGAFPAIVVPSTGQVLFEGVDWTPELAEYINKLIVDALEEVAEH